MQEISMLMQRGGPIMFPLLIVSVVSLGLMIERAIFWVTAGRRDLSALTRALRAGDRAASGKAIASDGSPYAQVARRLLKDGASEAVVMEAVEDQRSRFDRSMTMLSTIITAAPLLGILGTVIGIIQSFRLLGEQNTLADPREVSVGIAAALITTAFGLIIALMTLFPYMHFRRQADRALGRMESMVAAAEEGLAAR